MLFVFGYGSLVSPESAASTLGRPVDRASVPYARINGWKRAWNVGSDQHSHPERRFVRPDGSEYTGLTVVLGLDEDPAATCDGAVFAVTEGELARLDVRERNYDRVDVTATVSWPGKPDGCVVNTYLPSAVAQRRLADALARQRPIAVRRAYRDLVSSVLVTIPAIPFPVEDLVAHNDRGTGFAQDGLGTRQNG